MFSARWRAEDHLFVILALVRVSRERERERPPERAPSGRLMKHSIRSRARLAGSPRAASKRKLHRPATESHVLCACQSRARPERLLRLVRLGKLALFALCSSRESSAVICLLGMEQLARRPWLAGRLNGPLASWIGRVAFGANTMGELGLSLWLINRRERFHQGQLFWHSSRGLLDLQGSAGLSPAAALVGQFFRPIEQMFARKRLQSARRLSHRCPGGSGHH